MNATLSLLEYQCYEEMQDAFWGMLAEEAKIEGFFGVQESEDFLASLSALANQKIFIPLA